MSAGADDELGHAIGINLTRALGIEGMPALVAVIMRREDDVHRVLREQIPPLIQAGCVALRSNAVDRMMEVDDRTLRGIGFQVLLEPERLGRGARRLVELTGGIQADEVPTGRIKAIVVGDVVPIIKIAGRIAALVFVIADSGIGNGPEASEEFVRESVPIIKFGHRALLVNIAQIKE